MNRMAGPGLFLAAFVIGAIGPGAYPATAQEPGGGRPPPPACPPGGKILPPSVGATVTAFFGDATHPWPGDWAVDSAGIEPEAVTIRLRGPAAAAAQVRLVPVDRPGIAGRGKWFGFEVPADPSWLAATAAALDSRFPESPWVSCAAGEVSLHEDPDARVLRLTLPRWGALAAGVFQVLILLGAAFVSLRPGARRDPPA